MMPVNADQTAESHPNDGVLLGLIDAANDGDAALAPAEGERAELGAELRAAREHVARCEYCGARSAAIDARSRHVRDALAAIPIPAVSANVLRREIEHAARQAPEIPSVRRAMWRALAAGVVIAGVAAASPAVRDWVVGRARPSDTTQRSTAAAESTGGTAPRRAIARHGAVVSFAPSGADFTVRFDSLPAPITLTASRTAAADISARASDDADAEPLVVLPGALRVRNAAGSHTSYVIALPAGVTRLRVIVANDTLFDGNVPAVVRLGGRR